MQAANLEERGTLLTAVADGEEAVAEASVGELAAIALSWDATRFPGARIQTAAGTRLMPHHIVSLGKMLGIERDHIVPWEAESRILFGDTEETMTLRQAVIRWRDLPASTHALAEIQTTEMRARAETLDGHAIERLSRILAENGE